MDPNLRKQTLIPFLRNITIFSGALGVIAVLLLFVLPVRYFSPAFPFLIIFFMSMTILVYYILIMSFEKRFGMFVSYFLLSTAGKLLICITVAVIYVLLNKTDALPFLSGFFLLYVVYTIFEVVSLLRAADKIKRQ